MSATLFVNGRFLALDSARSDVRCVLVQNGRVRQVFSEAKPAVDADTVDLDGATLLPGLVDHHVHLAELGALRRQLDLRATRSLVEVLEKVRSRAEHLPAGSWIRGWGWNDAVWREHGCPSAGDLDRVAPRHPVFLVRTDGHAAWVSSRALERLDAPRRVEGANDLEVWRDRNGALRGVFLDNAMLTLSTELPRPDAVELHADLLAALGACSRIGLTAVDDMATSLQAVSALASLDAEGLLPVRVNVYLDAKEISPTARVEDFNSAVSTRLKIIGAKLFADGAMGSRGARLHAPYADALQSVGIWVTEPHALRERCVNLASRGFQLAVHAIGDEANHAALNALEAAQATTGAAGHRIEHAQLLVADDIPRFARLGVTVSMQPIQAISDMSWIEDRLGQERCALAYPCHTLAESGAHILFGSDAPIESENPWWGIAAAVSRQNAAGEPSQGWHEEQRLSLAQALRAYSATGLVLGGADVDSYTAGAHADFTVLDADLFQMNTVTLHAVEPRATIFQGVFKACR